MKPVEFTIPVVRGTQGGREFYLAMCPFRLLPRLFPPGIDNSASGRRHADRMRIREIARDILSRTDSYFVPAVTVSIERKVRFIAESKVPARTPAIGELVIPLDAKLTILDGTHRIYGLQTAVLDDASLADESLPMVLHVDPDGSRRSQILGDVKRYEHSTAKSLRIGHDEHDDFARLTRDVIPAVPVFSGSIEWEKTAISNRSRKLFTLSALYQANQILLADHKHDPYDQRLQLAIRYWTEVASRIPGWELLVHGDTSPAEIRAGYVHCHGIGLAAIARAGRALLQQSPSGWKKRLGKLSTLDWSRKNTGLWEGRAMIGGRLSKSSSAVALAGIAVMRHLGLKLSPEEESLDR